MRVSRIAGTGLEDIYTHAMQPVSAITTVLNEAKDIPQLITSLMAQEPPLTEVIVVDGGSTDGTWEWLEQAAARWPTLKAIRDVTCSLKYTPGPVSKGRNVAIAAAQTELVACADCGCRYRPDWAANLTAPLKSGEARYALGGSCLDMTNPTVWDLASAPFFGVKLAEEKTNKSCTARSMAFTRELWREIGGFPEHVLLGDDTLFDLKARALTKPAFVRARAFYRPHLNLAQALHQMARYAISDGILGVRLRRLFRNVARSLAMVAALVALKWTWIPLAVVGTLELYFAFRLDWLFARTQKPHVLLARLFFSLLVPWIVAVNQVRGALTKKNPTNAQNRRNAQAD